MSQKRNCLYKNNHARQAYRNNYTEYNDFEKPSSCIKIPLNQKAQSRDKLEK